jgi:hypothetical protein
MDGVGTLFGHLVYFTAILHILLPCGIFCCHLVCFIGYFIPFWYVVRRKIWQLCSRTLLLSTQTVKSLFRKVFKEDESKVTRLGDFSPI